MFLRIKNLLPFFILLISGHCKIDVTDQTYNDNGHMTIDHPDQHLEYHTLTSSSVRFYLYTPDNNTIEITPDNKQLLNMSHPTKIIIHGIRGYQNEAWIDQMVSSYHSKGDYNVVVVDWSKISNEGAFYAISAVNDVGEKVGEFIMEIIENNVAFLTDIHLIGSSLGSHVGGAAGNKIAEKNNKKVDRITAFDPNGDNADLQVLNEDSAEFVDVIHSSVHMGEQGYGTADFYVNTDDPSKIICINDSCSSVPAQDFYIFTILEANRFQGISCENFTLYIEKLCQNNTKVPMGEAVPRNISGSFYVSTDSAPISDGISLSHNILVLLGGLVFFHVMKL